jgi:hypothetical protein
MNQNISDYYLALLQVQMAVLGVVIAGIVALIQILNDAKPKRQTNLLVSPFLLGGYIGFLSLLLVVIAYASWVTTAPDDAARLFGQWNVTFFGDGATLLGMLVLSVLGLLAFAGLIYRSRHLLDPRLYLIKYVSVVPSSQVRDYLAASYSQDPAEQPKKMQRQHAGRDVRAFRRYFEREQTLYDPFQPINEYIKDNAFKLYDYGTGAGLHLFGELFDTSLAAIHKKPRKNEYYYLAKYLSDSALEFFAIFHKTSSEKRKMDVLRLVYEKGHNLLELSDTEGLLTIVRCLENIAKMTDDDDEIIAAVGYMHALTDAYLVRHKNAPWAEIATSFEEICLSVTRLSETYYLQKNNPLKTVPIIGYYTGEHHTVTAALVDFFRSYQDLADRYTDAYPMNYFAAIEAVIEALFARLSDIVHDGRQAMGLNATYHDLTYSLYSLYVTFGLDAVEHRKPELLSLCMSNIRRIIKPAKNMELESERRILTRMLLELALKGALELGDVQIKDDGRTIAQYTEVTLQKHASWSDITASLKELEAEGIDLKDAKLKAVMAAVHATKPKTPKA